MVTQLMRMKKRKFKVMLNGQPLVKPQISIMELSNLLETLDQSIISLELKENSPDQSLHKQLSQLDGMNIIHLLSLLVEMP
jgi:hypothetical protein